MSVGSTEFHRADATGDARRIGAVVPPAIGLVAGIMVGHTLGRAVVLPWLLASLLCLGGLLFRRSRRRLRVTLAGLTFAAFCLGAGRIGLEHPDRSLDALTRLAIDGPVLVVAEGIALRDDRPVPVPRGAMTRFDPRPSSRGFPMAVHGVVQRDGTRAPLRGRVLVVAEGDAPPVRAGVVVRMTGVLRVTDVVANPGPNAWRPGRRGARAILAADATSIRVLRGRTGWWHRMRHAMRARAATALGAESETPRDVLLAAMLLGTRDDGYAELSAGFQRVGLAHLLAISGLHLGLVAAAAMHVLGGLRGTRRARGWIVIALVIVYLVVVEVRLPLLRAGLMTIAACLGACGRRRLDAGGLVAGCAVALLLWRPEQVFTAGFQLSFGVVLGLVHLAPAVRRRWFGPVRYDVGTAGMLGQWAASAFATAATAWAVAAPLGIYHFGVLSPLAVPLSVIGVPLAALILLAGYARMLVALIVPAAGGLLDPLVTAVVAPLVGVVRLVDMLPASSLHLVPPSPAWVVATIAWVTWWGRREHRDGWRRLGPVAAGLALWLGATQVTWPPRPCLRLDMLAVGDGTCVLARSDGRAVLFDAGSRRVDAGLRVVTPALRRLGVRRLDAIIVSHPNLDHYAAVLDVVAAIPTRTVLITASFADAARVEASTEGANAARYVLDELAAAGVPVREVRAGATGRLGHTRWTWLHPPGGWSSPESNDASMAIEITAGSRRVLLLGDAEDAAMRAIAAAHAPLRADVVELPHHGARSRTAEWFVRGLQPALVLQSTGARRLERDPWPAALPGVPRLVTARDGAVHVEISRSGRLRWGTCGPPLRRSPRGRPAPPAASGARDDR